MTSSRVHKWLLSWDELFPRISLVCGSSALVFIAGRLITQGLVASKVFVWLFGIACSTVFLFAATYAVLAGLSIYHDYRRKTRFGAFCGFAVGLILGLFLTVLACAGLIAVSIS